MLNDDYSTAEISPIRTPEAPAPAIATPKSSSRATPRAELFQSPSASSPHTPQLDTSAKADAKLSGEVSGLLQIHNDKVSDKTAVDEVEKEDPSIPKEDEAHGSCQKVGCKGPDTKHMIACGDCRQWFHYECTALPPYQISTFVNSKRKFSCWTCLPPSNNIVNYFKKLPSLPSNPSSTPHATDPDLVRIKDLKDLERNIVKAMAAHTSDALNCQVKALRVENEGLQKKVAEAERDLKRSKTSLQSAEKEKSELEGRLQNIQLPPTHTGNEIQEAELKAKAAGLELCLEECKGKHKQELEDAKKAANTEISDLRSALAKNDDRVSDLSKSLERAEAETEALKAKCEQQARDLLATPRNAVQEDTSADFTPVTSPASTHRRDTSSKSKGSASEPDVLLVGNSLTGGLKPGQIFAPLYTRIETLDNKNLDGALEFIAGATDIKPKKVVLHCLENDISKTRSGENVITKLRQVISKCGQVFPKVPVMVVEPIGRGTNKDQYDRTAKYVRDHLSTVVPDDMIIKTVPLHVPDRKLFASDLVHLKPAGRAQLCIAYKQYVYPKLGMEYTVPSERSREDLNRSSHTTQRQSQDKRFHQRDLNRGPQRTRFRSHSDNRMVELVNLMKEVFQG